MQFFWELPMYWYGKLHSIYGSTLPKIRITSKKGSNKNCSKLNFIHKNQRTHMSISPGVEIGVFVSHEHCAHWCICRVPVPAGFLAVCIPTAPVSFASFLDMIVSRYSRLVRCRSWILNWKNYVARKNISCVLGVAFACFFSLLCHASRVCVWPICDRHTSLTSRVVRPISGVEFCHLRGSDFRSTIAPLILVVVRTWCKGITS